MIRVTPLSLSPRALPKTRSGAKLALTGRIRRGCAVRGAKEGLWALDFDGVICDSCGESSLSAWKAASKLWPDLLQSHSAQRQKDDVIANMRVVRPVVETGYENIVQIRCLLEGVDPQDMLLNWGTILEDSMQKWELDRANLVELFGSTRDAWIQQDLASWLAPNKIFDGISESLPTLMERCEVYIVTTKQARFTHVLLRDMAQVDFPMERIISTTVSGQPKTEILLELQSQYDLPQYFIEDKLSTLHKVCGDAQLVSWQLYLADWGYNTSAERHLAAKNPRIEVLSLPHFEALLSDGLLPR